MNTRDRQLFGVPSPTHKPSPPGQVLPGIHLVHPVDRLAHAQNGSAHFSSMHRKCPLYREGKRHRVNVRCPFLPGLICHQERRDEMPILLWLLGVPVSLILVLWLFGVVGF